MSHALPPVDRASSPEDAQQAGIMLRLLDAVERDGGQSQRHLASELGIALGLVNAYLKRCVKKGLVKVSDAPARRYFYYLTPKGLAEKTQLTVTYLSYSFEFFRRAKADCVDLLTVAQQRGFQNLAIAGRSDLAEIVMICAVETGVRISAVVDPAADAGAGHQKFLGVDLFHSFEALSPRPDAIIICDLRESRKIHADAVHHFGGSRVLVPKLMGLDSAAGGRHG